MVIEYSSMQFIQGNNRNQTYFTTLEDKVNSTKNKRRTVAAFLPPGVIIWLSKKYRTTQWMLKYVDPIAIGFKKLLNLNKEKNLEKGKG